MFKGLNASELFKVGREYRAKLIVKKIEEGRPFFLVTGKEVIITNDKATLFAFNEAYKSKNSRVLNNITFTDMRNKKYTIKDFAKSAEFGGRGAGSGTKGEDAALSDLQNKLADILIKEGTPYIKLKIGNRTSNVSAIESTPGTPKSDFHFLDEKNKECFWISHKVGSTAKDFQQYGGMIELEDMSDIQDFAKTVKEYLNGQDSLPPKLAFGRKVTDRNVMLRSLFGKDYKAGPATSRQNIDVLFQGEMNFVKVGDVFIIKSNHTVLRGSIPTESYEPWYFVRQSKDRSQFGIKAARFFIVPRHLPISRKAHII